MRVDIWSDVVCPWCAIGVARFERALQGYTGAIDVRLHPFQLDPQAPIPGVPARLRYDERFGEESGPMLARVTAAAEEEGLRFDFDRALSANTFDAHRAIAYARAFGADRAMERRLFSAYFSEGMDVSDRATLVAAGSEIGLDRGDLARYLESDRGVAALLDELNDAFERGITSVPTFVFEEEFAVPGAVDTGTFTRIFEQMRALEAR